MNIRNWKVFSGLFAVILAVTAFITPAAMAKGQDGGGQRGARLLVTTAAEELDMTPQELVDGRASGGGSAKTAVAAETCESDDTIIDAVVEKVSEKLTEKVADGDMTQTEADERLAQVEEKVTEAVNSSLPERGQGKQGKRGGRALLRVAAEELGMTPQELVEELRSEEGRTIADVAADNSVSVDTIIDAAVEKASEKLAEKVANGDMTQAEADERLTQIEEKVTEAVNSPLPERGQRGQRNNGDSA